MKNDTYSRKRYKFDAQIEQLLIPLYMLDNWHGLFAVLYDYTVIVAAILLSKYSMWFYPLSLVLIASRQRALSTLLHESAHRCLTKNKTLNDIIGTFMSGYLILQSFNTYHETHIKKHHAFLGNKELDPDYEIFIKLGMYINPKNHLSMSIVSLSAIKNYIFYIIRNRIISKVKLHKEQFVQVVYLTIILLFLYKMSLLTDLFIFWIIPLITAFPLIGFFIELAEHYPLMGKNTVDLYMTRNRDSHWFEMVFMGIHQENYHLVHHLKPRIPFWNLRKTHDILMADNNYRKANDQMGGIFISRNKTPPLLKVNVF